MSCVQNDPAPHHSLGLETLAFEIIEQCNFSCAFCVRNAQHRAADRVALAPFRQRLSTALAAFPETRLLALTGGEPFLHPELLEISRAALATGRHLSITSNGSVVQEAVLQELARSERGSVIVSLDGPSAEIHDTIRGFPGALARLDTFLQTCRDHQLPYGINITVAEENAASVEETLYLAARLGAVDVSVALVKPEGRGGVLPRHVLPAVARQVERAKAALYGQMGVRFSEPLAHLVDLSLFASGRRRRCGASGTALHLQCDGAILLCTSCTQALGNIDQLEGAALRAAWESDSRLERIRAPHRLAGACGDCLVAEFCGGCRCRAEKAGDFLGADPLCPRVIAPQTIEQVDRRLTTALARITPANATDPEALQAWLRQWCAGESFDRAVRDFSAQRRWGHDYPLGPDEQLQGEMGRRHIDVLRAFLLGGALALDLTDQRILDIGPWTGGEALLLAALGAEVDFVEEHADYREVTLALAKHLRLPVTSVGDSLYRLPAAPLPHYNVVYLAGIVTHLSDPIMGLRIAFEQLKVGGICLIETQTSYAADGRDEFWGGDRPGWIWWNLSRVTLLEILHNVGFEQVEIVSFGRDRRVQLCARKLGPRPMKMQMGLSHRAQEA